MERIKAIEEVENYVPVDGERWAAYEGYKITTSKQEILVLINQGQGCCESFGFQGHPETEVGCYGGVYEGIGELIMQHGKDFGIEIVDLQYPEDNKC